MASRKSDRRDTGKPESSSLTLSTDNDIHQVELQISPAISIGQTSWSALGETDRAVFWMNANRSGGEAPPSGTIDNSTLPQSCYVESVYPNTLNSSGTTTGKITVHAECTLDGSKSEVNADLKMHLDANCTYYTLPHEEEYSTSTVSFPVYFIDNYSQSNYTNISVNSDFKDDTEVQGHGLLRTPVTAFNGITTKTYTYLAFAKLEGAWQFCLDTSAKTACGNQVGPISTAKWSGNGGLLSVFDRDNPPVALKIPLLHERIIDASTSATWLGNLISEDRQLDDLGGGGGVFDCKPKWLDIYVEYVPRSSRPSEYQGHTMVGILGGGNDPMKWEEQLPRLNNLRVEWAE